MSVNILADIRDSSSSGDSSGTWTMFPGLREQDVTVQGTNSVLLIIGTAQPLAETDSTAEYRLTINGTGVTSPIITCFSDSPTGEEVGNATIAFAVTGLSGSTNNFEMQWRTVTGAPSKDTSRVSSLMILEIVGGDASIIANIFTQAAANPGATWTDLFATGTVGVQGTSSILLMLANVPLLMAADASCDFQFSVDGTQEGAITTVWTDAASEGNGWSGIHVLTGLSAGSHTFELAYQDRYGAPVIDDTRDRTFQVIEITAAATLKSSIISAAAHSAGASWADDGTLDATVNVGATANTILQIANVTPAQADTTDRTTGFRLAVDGSQEGADVVDFGDTTDRINRTLLGMVKTGISGNHDFSLQWINVQASSIADTGRNRSQFVIEFTEVTYDLEGITYDKDGDVLGSCEVYLFKDNGAAFTLSFIDYVVSDFITGAYSFTVSDEDDYLVVAFKDLTPNVFDVTDHNLLPKITPTESYDLYLRSDVNKGETPVSKNLRLRTQADKEVQAVEISTTLRGHLSEHLTIASTLRGYLQKSDVEIATTLRAYLQQHVEIASTLRGYLQKSDIEIATDLRAYLQKSDIEIATTLRGHLSEHLTIASTLRGYLQQYVEVTTDLRAYLQKSDIEVTTDLRAYLQKSDVEVATDLRGYLQKSDVEVASSIRGYLQKSDIEVATTLRGHLSEHLTVATDLRGYLQALDVEVASSLRAWLTSQQVVPTTLRAWLSAVDLEVATDLRGHLSEHLTIASTLRGHLSEHLTIGSTLRGYLQKHTEIATTLRGHLSEHLTITTDLRGYLQKHTEIATTLRGHLSKNYTVATDLRGYLQKSGIEIAADLRAYLQKSDIEVATDLRAYLEQRVQVATTLRGYLSKLDIEVATDLRAYLQKSDIEVATTLRAYLASHVTVASSLRAYLYATRTESTDLRAYLSALATEISTTLSAYLQEFTFEPHECFKASPREKFVASPREKFVADSREKFSSAPDSCPLKED